MFSFRPAPPPPPPNDPPQRRNMDPINVTTEVALLLGTGGQAVTIGFLCIQGQGTRICSGCTSACDQSVVLIQAAA